MVSETAQTILCIVSKAVQANKEGGNAPHDMIDI
jgi:hypothetical protein